MGEPSSAARQGHGGSRLPGARPDLPPTSRPVALWLFAIAALVFCMVVVGGLTRLTGSGLSITQWRPLSGALPPMSAAAWERLFSLYRATPQYRLVNVGMSLAQFRFIFWWEWTHRLLGRLIGVGFALPFGYFLVRRRIPRRLAWPCAGLLALGALQGLVGWWMVKSGLEARTSVAPERLAVHLGLALALYAALIWAGLEAWAGRAAQASRSGWRIATRLLAAGVFLQCLLGALLAGSRGGLIDNDWPLMAGRVFPAGYWRGSLSGSVLEGPVGAQFDHRIGAYLLLAATLALAIRSARAPEAALRRLIRLLAAAVLAQAALGIATLRLVDPVPLAILHQGAAALLLALAVVTAWRASRTFGIQIPRPKPLQAKELSPPLRA